MKRRVKKLIMLSVSTLMAASSLATSTYAWFKLNSTATVENFNFEVVSGLGFEVSIDGVHYYTSLDLTQMKKAMVASYDPSMYQIRGVDEEGNDKADVLYKYNGSQFKELPESNAEAEMQAVLNKIKLLPATTLNGRDVADLYNGIYSTTSGRFLEFGVYFKATSDNPNDNLKYDIYMNGYDGLEDRGDQMVDTIFTSKTTNVPLSASMTAVRYSADGSKYVEELTSAGGGRIIVYSSNAARISTTESIYTYHPEKYYETTDQEIDTTKTYYTKDGLNYNIYEGIEFIEDVIYYEYQPEYYSYDVNENSSLIYEINDTENLNTDLGSYATNYSEYNPTDQESNNYYLYNCDVNAMYTYYNHLRTDGNLQGKALDYNGLPKNIIRALPTRKSSDINKASSPSEANDSTYYPITTVESGADAKLITFRVWLEGWDADCFDGLSNSIDLRLAFSSKRVY